MHFTQKLLLVLSILAIFFSDQKENRINDSFITGEELTFKVKYLFFNAAEAKLVVHKDIFQINDRPSYKIDVFGRTLSIFKIFYVKDNWGTYMDTSLLIPHISYRHIEEGNYRKHEVINFDQDNKKARVDLFDRDNKRVTETMTYPTAPDIQDIVSGFYQFRTMDLSLLKKGEVVTIKGFFDKEIYNLKLIFEGKEKISTRIGDFNSFIFSPVMPNNKLFSGENPIKIWVSDDKNRIPVRIKANLVVGSLDMEITEARGLRNN